VLSHIQSQLLNPAFYVLSTLGSVT